MTISDISIRRPVFATVISLMLVILGLVSLTRIAVREYPDVDPVFVSVTTDYRGAGAAIVENKITQVIEDRIAGLEGIETVRSSSRDGRSSINIEFAADRDVDAAANDVRDRVGRVIDDLPEEASPPEIQKAESGPEAIMFLNLSSDRMSVLELTDYADRVLIDQLSAIPGVARVNLSGERRQAVRIWIDRQALAARALTVADIEAALRRENVELPAGRLESTEREFSLRTDTGLSRVEDFRRLALGRGPDGYVVRLGDVARVELGAENDRTVARTLGLPGISLGIEQMSKANTLEVAEQVRETVARIQPGLPEGMSLVVNFDRAVFIDSSLREVEIALCISLVDGPARHLPVPRQPAGDAGAGRDDPDLDHRDLPVHGRDGLLGQRADAARHGARDRARGGRRDRRAREHLPPHRGRPEAVAGGARRQPGDRLRRHRDDAGADLGVRADLVPAGRDRPAVPRIRLHAGRGGRVLLPDRADADAGDGLAHVPRARAAQPVCPAPRRFFPFARAAL